MHSGIPSIPISLCKLHDSIDVQLICGRPLTRKCTRPTSFYKQIQRYCMCVSLVHIFLSCKFQKQWPPIPIMTCCIWRWRTFPGPRVIATAHQPLDSPGGVTEHTLAPLLSGILKGCRMCLDTAGAKLQN